MISYLEIVASITRKIKASFDIPIYGDEILEGYNKPCFFVEVLPVEIKQYTRYLNKNHLTVRLSYFTDNTSSIQGLMFCNSVKLAIGRTLEVENRSITIPYINISKGAVELDSYEITFDLKYYDNVFEETSDENIELIGEVIYTGNEVH